MAGMDITVDYRPTRREARELWRRCADTITGLGVQDLYAVDLIPPPRGRRCGFEIRLCALFTMGEGVTLTDCVDP
jgi:hypothetical protein